jgi:hypothetical protein
MTTLFRVSLCNSGLRPGAEPGRAQAAAGSAEASGVRCWCFVFFFCFQTCESCVCVVVLVILWIGFVLWIVMRCQSCELWWDEMWILCLCCYSCDSVMNWWWDEMRWHEMRKKGKERKRKGKGNGGPTDRWRKSHLYRGVTPLGRNIHICTGWDTRFKCDPTFVPDSLYRFNTWYKWGLWTGTNARLLVVSLLPSPYHGSASVWNKYKVVLFLSNPYPRHPLPTLPTARRHHILGVACVDSGGRRVTPHAYKVGDFVKVTPWALAAGGAPSGCDCV